MQSWPGLDSGICLCGNFTTVGGLPRNRRGAGRHDWRLVLLKPGSIHGRRVSAVLVNGARAYILGNFTAVGAALNSSVAEVNAVTVDVPVPRPPSADLSLSSRPNPIHGAGRISFLLPRPGQVSLGVYDASGREVARLADHKSFGAGWQEIPFDGSSLRSGIYVCRLRTGGQSVARRIVVIP